MCGVAIDDKVGPNGRSDRPVQRSHPGDALQEPVAMAEIEEGAESQRFEVDGGIDGKRTDFQRDDRAVAVGPNRIEHARHGNGATKLLLLQPRPQFPFEIGDDDDLGPDRTGRHFRPGCRAAGKKDESHGQEAPRDHPSRLNGSRRSVERRAHWPLPSSKWRLYFAA
jgi:hypothetical protein